MNRDLLPAAVVAVAVHAGVLVAMPSPFRPADAKVSVDDGLRVVMLAVTAAPQTETAPETPIDLPPPPTAPPPPPDAANAAQVAVATPRVAETPAAALAVEDGELADAEPVETEAPVKGTFPFFDPPALAVPLAIPEPKKGNVPGERDPVAVDNDPPAYPRRAQDRGWQGTVVLRVEVLANGTCGAVEIETSSGHGILDRAAVRAVKAWRFEPATRGGQAIRKWIEVPVEFQIEDEERECSEPPTPF